MCIMQNANHCATGRLIVTIARPQDGQEEMIKQCLRRLDLPHTSLRARPSALLPVIVKGTCGRGEYRGALERKQPERRQRMRHCKRMLTDKRKGKSQEGKEQERKG
ncbi:hypothetical protein AALO_G00253290, partial [Alosa alosa]